MTIDDLMKEFKVFRAFHDIDFTEFEIVVRGHPGEKGIPLTKNDIQLDVQRKIVWLTL